MSGTLPNWMERWLGLGGGLGEGASWRIGWHWPWPPWATLLVLVTVVAAVVAIYLREGRKASGRYRLALAAMRLAVVAIVLAMIAQPEVSIERTSLPTVAVVLDDSRSMTTVDHYAQDLGAALAERLQETLGKGTVPFSSNENRDSPRNEDRDSPHAKSLSRWNLATMLLAERGGMLLSGLVENYKLRFYFLTGMRSSRQAEVTGIVKELATAEPNGESTRLGAGIRSVLDELRGTSPAAIVLLTDGINTEGPSLAETATYAMRKGVPLFFVGIGSDQPVREVRLSDLLVDDVVFVNDVVNFRFKLSGVGLQGKKLSIVLRQEGKPVVLAKVEATLGHDGRPQDVRLPYRPTQVGRFRYVIDVEPPEGELAAKGPPLVRSIQVRKEKIRVLLVQAYPSFEYRFLRNMLARDDTIELHTVLQDADVEYAEQDKAALRVFPTRREELFSYDVVILGDASPAFLGPTALRNLADFVDSSGHGGALMMLAGPKYMPQAYRDTPLARLLPFDPLGVRMPDPGKPLVDGFVAEPTEVGLAVPPMQLGDTLDESRTIWRKLPPLYWMIEIGELKPGARVLADNPLHVNASGKPLPLVVMQYVGAGKVFFDATDETWRWRRREGDVFFARYWIQTIRWLARSKLSEGDRSARLSTDRREYRVGESVHVQVRFADERLAPPEDNGVTVVLERQGRKTQRIELQRTDAGRGIFEAVLGPLPVGGYHAWMATPAMAGGAPSVDFTVVPPEDELADVQMDAAEMRRAAEATKGQFYMFADADRLLADLPEGREVPIETLPPLPLWNKWPVLALLLVLLIGEWLCAGDEEWREEWEAEY